MTVSRWRIGSILVGLGALALALLAPGVCSAEEGEFQLGLGTPFFLYSSSTTEMETDTVTTEVDDTDVNWGIGNDVILELGYGVTPNILVGGLVRLSGTSSDSEDEDGDETESSTFDFFLGPKFDWVFLPGDRLQPFAGAVLGLSYQKASANDNEASLTGFGIMGRFGARIFPKKEFSIDPYLTLSYASASGEGEFGPLNYDVSASGFTLALMVGVSGFMD